MAPTGRLFQHFHPFVGHHDLSQSPMPSRSPTSRTSATSKSSPLPAGLADTLETRPALASWWVRCSAREAWKYTLGMTKFVEEKALPQDPLGREKPWDP